MNELTFGNCWCKTPTVAKIECKTICKRLAENTNKGKAIQSSTEDNSKKLIVVFLEDDVLELEPESISQIFLVFQLP